MLRSKEETSSLQALSWAFSLDNGGEVKVMVNVVVKDMVNVNGHRYGHKL